MVSKATVKLEFQFSLSLTEVEARALDGLFGYGADELLHIVYQQLGTAYIKPHDAGFRSLAKAVVDQLRPQLSQAEKIKQAAVDLQVDGVERATVASRG